MIGCVPCITADSAIVAVGCADRGGRGAEGGRFGEGEGARRWDWEWVVVGGFRCVVDGVDEVGVGVGWGGRGCVGFIFFLVGVVVCCWC